ncbi:Peroxisomal docking factor component Pex13-Penicillium chrysogenum [Trichophyton interdigitale]|uniref:Peroxisomal membrane protein PEX13 n=1 Tax=Trichophyton interdigitale TaxID=101480 RepID=A0A9P4YJT2_9EURO|nr:Peroxisomal docking factor component Pex13-Penicillium chrysogenum [Trichophyton interdigitale]KAF3900257.1 Peroxisomal docking factor component Pex13-Penicillium chrysogenum [Trichophyton interdigitale]KAG8212577.1 Peroxisomal docking factor component Pex13-Penicillium chrysogenum [Trichophyton interdigitale]
MASVSPPKPWERAAVAASGSSVAQRAVTASAAPQSSTTAVTPSSSTTSSSSSAPELPSRPSALNAVVNQTASTYSPYGASRLGTSPYTGGYNNYSSPYSRFGAMGGMGSMYGGYGGMGGMYGSYGGMGGMYGGMQNGDPNSLTHSFNQSTQATFQMIESIVGAFGGFAQMLESTYMATHSSFFAMVSVAEQFGTLKNTLGSVLGIFTLLRWLRTLLAKLTGRPPPADATALTPSAFSAFTGNNGGLPDGSGRPRPSKKPFFFFLAAVFGLPYLMSKLIRVLARSQELEAKRQQELLNEAQQQGSVDPSKLDFCRVLYDYSPDTQATGGIDLAVKKGDLVAVLSKSDPMGNPSEWWRCRSRDGSVGYLPSPYLEAIQRRPQQQAITAGAANSTSSAPATRTSTLVGNPAESRTKSLTALKQAPEPVKGKPTDISLENFQKSNFYS